MPLTHVCIWDSKIGYRRITIDEACEMYPYRVSARSGHFVCELCAQNVLLTAPGENVRHFRHDPGSPNKECDERQAYFDPTYGRTMGELSSHEMPLRILVAGTTFSLQLGFFRSSGNNAHCDRIKIAGDSHQIFEYSFERVGQNGTTYLSVGSIPNRFYEIEYVNANTDLFGVVVEEASKVENPIYCQTVADRVGGNMAKHSIEMDISGDNRSVVAAALTDNPKVRVFTGYNSLISTAGSQYILDTFPQNEWDEYAFFSAGVMGNEYEYLIGAVAEDAGTRSVFRGAAQFGGGDAAATLVALTKAVMFGEESVDYGKLNANSIGMYVPIAAELNNGVPALVSFDTASHIEYYTLEEILKLDNLVTYWDAANGYNPAEQDTGAAELPPLDAAPAAEGAKVYTCVLSGPMGDDNLQFVLNDDGICEFSLPGNPMITDVYAGTYTQEGNVVSIKGLTNVDESSEYKIPGLWSFIDSATGDATIYVLSDGTFSVEPVEDSGYPIVLSCVLAGPMGDDNLQIVLNADGSCEFSLPGNPMITDVYTGTYERNGDTVSIKGLTNVDESSEYKIPGLWSFIDSATGDAVITVDEAAGTFTSVE